MLDYRIDTFITLYEEMNYRRTAERLSMTHPALLSISITLKNATA